MAIVKADLLDAVNDNLERNETNIDRQIKRALLRISNSNTFLANIDTSNTIDSDTNVIDVPDNFKKLQNIRLQNVSSELYSNWLNRITYQEYLTTYPINISSVSTQFALYNNRQIYFLPFSDQEYTVEISYFSIHPPTPDDIIFDDRFLSVLESACTFEVALKFNMTDEIRIWSQVYGQDLKDVNKYAQKMVDIIQFRRP